MITDPVFYWLAIPAVIITGISKGGFGGVALLAVPMMALVTSPVRAAGIMLPILIVMDVITLWVYARSWHKQNLILLFTGALVGIAVGAITAGYVSDNAVRIVVGLVAVVFTLHYYLMGQNIHGTKPNRLKGIFWGSLAGFTSFVAHAGSPPFQAYLAPQRLDRRIYVGTAAVFFALVNATKLIPYAWLGQLSSDNLVTSLILLPFAPLGVAIGVWANRRLSNDVFYHVIYGLIFLVGLRLIWDGIQ